MANIIRIKRRAAGGAAGAPSSLASAEMAYNEEDNILYYGRGDDGGGNATSIISIAGIGAVLGLSGAQTVTGDKTFTGAVALGSAATATTQDASDNSTAVATTGYVKAQNYLTGNQTVTLSGDATGSGATSITVTLANSGVVAGDYTKITVDAKGRVTAGAQLAAGDIPSLTAAKISDFDTQVRSNRLDQMADPTAAISVNGQRITSLAAPTAGTDAANRDYVDAVAKGLTPKEAVRAATTANISLSGEQTIDGVALSAGDRVLVKDQTTGADNGIYVVAAGAWSRAADADSSDDVKPGTFAFVSEGSVNGDISFVLTTDAPITLGSTSLSFTQMTGQAAGETNTASNVGSSGVGVYDGKSGVDLQFRKVNAASNTLSVSLNGQQIDVALVPTNITSLGTITTGVWQGSAIGLGYGGTGADLSGASDGAIFKKSGAGLVAATAGTDYLSSTSEIDGGTF